MQVQLNEIDVTPLDELTRIKGELETLDGRLQAMEARRAEVAEPVYVRVRGDYEARRSALEQEAAPLKAAAREQYAKLHALLARSEADHEASRLDREEIDFRHSLGEFDDAEYQRRIAEVDQQLAGRAEAHEQAVALRQRFVAAFRSEDELQGPAASGPSAGAPVSASGPATVKLPVMPEPAAETRQMPLPSAADLGATQTMRVLGDDARKGSGPVRADQTVMIRSARLLPQNPQAGKLTHTVGLRPLTVGSAEQCDVIVPGTAARHAQLKAGMSGYTISDLGGGVRVNGIAIEQHLLRHDDVVEIGPARFAFREN